METCILIPKELGLVMCVNRENRRCPRNIFDLDVTLYTNQHLTPGLTFHPDQGEIRLDTLECFTTLSNKNVRFRFGCEEDIVEVEGRKVRHCNWVRFIQSTNSKALANMTASLVQGQAVFKVMRNIYPNEELCVYFKDYQRDNVEQCKENVPRGIKRAPSSTPFKKRKCIRKSISIFDNTPVRRPLTDFLSPEKKRDVPCFASPISDHDNGSGVLSHTSPSSTGSDKSPGSVVSSNTSPISSIANEESPERRTSFLDEHTSLPQDECFLARLPMPVQDGSPWGKSRDESMDSCDSTPEKRLIIDISPPASPVPSTVVRNLSMPDQFNVFTPQTSKVPFQPYNITPVVSTAETQQEGPVHVTEHLQESRTQGYSSEHLQESPNQHHVTGHLHNNPSQKTMPDKLHEITAVRNPITPKPSPEHQHHIEASPAPVYFNEGQGISPPSVMRRREKTWLPCDVCGKKFDRPSLLKRHMRTHTGEKPHACDVCNKAFSTSSSLNTHRRIHSGEKPHQCQVCGKCFTASSNLYYHRMTHKKEKPHKCTLCSKSFPTPGDLRSHMYVHNGSWPFKCDVCNRGFSKQTNLKNHMLLHTGDKPHICQYCGKKFALQCNLKTHIRTHEEEGSPSAHSQECRSCGILLPENNPTGNLCHNCVISPRDHHSNSHDLHSNSQRDIHSNTAVHHHHQQQHQMSNITRPTPMNAFSSPPFSSPPSNEKLHLFRPQAVSYGMSPMLQGSDKAEQRLIEARAGLVKPGEDLYRQYARNSGLHHPTPMHFRNILPGFMPPPWPMQQ